MNIMYEGLNVKLDIKNYFCRVDLQALLKWIKPTNREFKAFV